MFVDLFFMVLMIVCLCRRLLTVFLLMAVAVLLVVVVLLVLCVGREPLRLCLKELHHRQDLPVRIRIGLQSVRDPELRSAAVIDQQVAVRDLDHVGDRRLVTVQIGAAGVQELDDDFFRGLFRGSRRVLFCICALIGRFGRVCLCGLTGSSARACLCGSANQDASPVILRKVHAENGQGVAAACVLVRIRCIGAGSRTAGEQYDQEQKEQEEHIPQRVIP